MSRIVFRVAKVKSLGDLSRLAQHNMRTGSEVRNARQPYSVKNLVGKPDIYQGVVDSLPEKRRKDAVLAMEFVLTASPEWFSKDGTDGGPRDMEKVKLFHDKARAWLRQEFGECVHARLHLDEKTPHWQGFIVPNKGFKPGESLTAKTLFSPETLEQYQDKAGEYFGAIGLERGERGSMAVHEDIKSYYRRVNAAPVELPPAPKPVPPATTAEAAAEAIGLPTKHSKLVDEATAAQRMRADAALKVVEKSSAQAREATAKAQAAESRAIRAEKLNASLKATTDKLRDLPLWHVLELMGCEPKPGDRSKWVTPAGVVSITKGDPRFNSFENPEVKGRGAIDLVMRVQGLGFTESVSWLAQRTGDFEAVAGAVASHTVENAATTVLAAVKTAPEAVSSLPVPRPGLGQRVRSYLIEKRQIAVQLVDRLMQAGRLYADRYANACFLTDDRQGVEMRGTGPTPFHGWRGHKRAFTVDGDPQRVAIVESAIEALSLRELHGVTAVSVGGTNPEVAADVARQALARGAEVYAAQNADKAGDSQAKSVMQAVEGVQRMRPPEGKDWNDVLKDAKADGGGRPPAAPRPAPHKLKPR